jgi:hypothetical protein
LARSDGGWPSAKLPDRLAMSVVAAAI